MPAAEHVDGTADVGFESRVGIQCGVANPSQNLTSNGLKTMSRWSELIPV